MTSGERYRGRTTREAPKTIGIRPADENAECCWDDCRLSRSVIFPFMLCDDHVMLIHDFVQAQQNSRLPVKTSPKKRARMLSDATAEVEQAGWIYYLRIGERLKIGYAGDLARRLHQYPPNAELLAAYVADKATERRIHGALTASLREGREWYAFTDEINTHIRAVVELHGTPNDPRTWTASHAVRRETGWRGSDGGPRKVG